MPQSNLNLLILVGYGDDDFDLLRRELKSHLNIPVETASLEGAVSVGEAIQAGVAAHSPRYVIVLPLFVGASEAKHRNVQMIVDGANERGFDMVAHYGKPLGVHAKVIAAYSDQLAQIHSDTNTALLVVGRGSKEPNSNAEAYHIARLLYEGRAYHSVDIAFYGTTTPKIAAGIQRAVQTGAQRIIVVPYTFYDAHLAAAITAQVQQQDIYPDVELLVSTGLGGEVNISQAVSQRYEEALAELKAGLSNDGRYISKPHSHGPNGTPHTHSSFRIAGFTNPLLPPRYQGDVSISAAPMGAADLVYDVDGRVAWDQIWGDFCDLALAGGPPHRGTLLEPVAPEAVRANPQRYQAVLAELERGIRMITGLPIVTGSAGWIGVRCDSEEMALWLLRAIVVENISVRREDDVLYFPAGPDFRLEAEIKNVITVIAKTHHYWTEHVNSG